MEERLGERLRRRRKECKLSQQQVADQLNLAKSTISQYESNTNEPDADTLARLARIYHVSIDWLVTGDSSEGDQQRDFASIDPDIQEQLLRIQEKSKLAHIQGALPRSSSQTSLKKHLETYETILDEIIRENQKR